MLLQSNFSVVCICSWCNGIRLPYCASSTFVSAAGGPPLALFAWLEVPAFLNLAEHKRCSWLPRVDRQALPPLCLQDLQRVGKLESINNISSFKRPEGIALSSKPLHLVATLTSRQELQGLNHVSSKKDFEIHTFYLQESDRTTVYGKSSGWKVKPDYQSLINNIIRLLAVIKRWSIADFGKSGDYKVQLHHQVWSTTTPSLELWPRY